MCDTNLKNTVEKYYPTLDIIEEDNYLSVVIDGEKYPLDLFYLSFIKYAKTVINNDEGSNYYSV